MLGASPSQEVKCFALGRGEVVTAFSDQLQGEVRTEAVDCGDVLAEQPEQRRADVESQSVRLIGSVPTPRGRRR